MAFYHVAGLLLLIPAVAPAAEPDWTPTADRKPPMTVAEARSFIRRLTQYVVDHHLNKDEQSPQRGMIYEYFWVAKQGPPQQWIQGEALDTMHDGAWFACAMVNAYPCWTPNESRLPRSRSQVGWNAS